MKKTGTCDIVIPTYNGSSHLPRLLSSIERQSMDKYNCYVIDDNSRDETVEIVRRDYPWVHILAQSENMGPSYNRNVAARQGTSPYIVIFDDDTYLDDDRWLENAVQYMEENPDVGQLATMIVNGFEPHILLDCGIAKNWYLFGGLFHNVHRDDAGEKHKRGRMVLGACTAGTIMRRALFERVGGFDSRYYYPAEDLDLSLRFHLAGAKVWYEPSLLVYHYESQAMGKSLARKMFLYRRNCLLALIDNFPVTHIFVMLLAVFGREIVKPVLKYVLQRLGRGERQPLSDSVSDYLKALFFIARNSPGTLRKRVDSRRYRQRSRRSLLDINRDLLRDVAR